MLSSTARTQSAMLRNAAARATFRGTSTPWKTASNPNLRLFTFASRRTRTPWKDSAALPNLRFSTFTSRRPIEKGSGEGLQARLVSSISNSSKTWSRIAFFVKVTRIPILITAIYTLGYQNGVTESVRNPLKLQQGTFEEICASFGVTNGKQVAIVSEKTKDPTVLGRIGWTKSEQDDNQSEQTLRVSKIGRQIIHASRMYVRQELNAAITKAKERLKDKEGGLSQVDYTRLLNSDEDVERWTHALERIEGYTIDGIQNWQYVLIDTEVPNAFVSEMLPQRFFVTTGLFKQFVNNDDELAMILGHEISHLVVGHSSQSNIIEFMFRGLEITLLMLDPTEGMLSLMVASFLGSSREALVAAYSRSNETEADELGCKLAAMACFNTTRGSKVFLKMHEFDEANGTTNNSLMSSHPASAERYEFVKKLSEEEKLAKYSYCNTLRKRLQRAMTARRDYEPREA